MLSDQFIGAVRSRCHDARAVRTPQELYIEWVEKNAKTPGEKTALEFIAQSLPLPCDSELKSQHYYHRFSIPSFLRLMQSGHKATVWDEDDRFMMSIGDETFSFQEKPLTMRWISLGVKIVLPESTDYEKLKTWLSQALSDYHAAKELLAQANITIVERAARRRMLEWQASQVIERELSLSNLGCTITAYPDRVELKIGREGEFSVTATFRDEDSLAEKMTSFIRSVVGLSNIADAYGWGSTVTLEAMEDIQGEVDLLMEDRHEVFYRMAKSLFSETFPMKFLREIECYDDRLIIRTRAGSFSVFYNGFRKELKTAFENMSKYMRRPLRYDL